MTCSDTVRLEVVAVAGDSALEQGCLQRADRSRSRRWFGAAAWGVIWGYALLPEVKWYCANSWSTASFPAADAMFSTLATLPLWNSTLIPPPPGELITTRRGNKLRISGQVHEAAGGSLDKDSAATTLYLLAETGCIEARKASWRAVPAGLFGAGGTTVEGTMARGGGQGCAGARLVPSRRRLQSAGHQLGRMPEARAQSDVEVGSHVRRAGARETVVMLHDACNVARLEKVSRSVGPERKEIAVKGWPWRLICLLVEEAHVVVDGAVAHVHLVIGESGVHLLRGRVIIHVTKNQTGKHGSRWYGGPSLYHPALSLLTAAKASAWEGAVAL